MKLCGMVRKLFPDRRRIFGSNVPLPPPPGGLGQFRFNSAAQSGLLAALEDI